MTTTSQLPSPTTDSPTGAPARAARPTGTDVVGTARYVQPGWFTRRVFNPTVAFLTRRGLSVKGTRILEVRGRRSG